MVGWISVDDGSQASIGRAILPGGNIDLSLNPSGYARVGKLTDDILEALRNCDGFIDGTVPIYYRSRGRGWSLTVDEDWEFCERLYTWPEGSWVGPAESEANIRRAVKAWWLR